MPSPLELRRIDTTDPADTGALDAWTAQLALVFTAPFVAGPERREALRPRYAGHRVSGVFDCERLVGTYRSWDWEVGVPGGARVTADAVSSVTVRPTHRRRGVLRSMIVPDLIDAHARGVPLAVLIASEATIYGRFGFGPATECATWQVDLAAAQVAAQVPRGGALEVITPAELHKVAPGVFEAARGPGATDRDEFWWRLQCGLESVPGDRTGPRAAVVHRDAAGVPQGFALWSWKDEWHERACRTVATVEDLHAVTAEAYAGLWRFFAELDLVATVRANDRPVDEPLPWLLTDPRAARRTASADFLWVRLLDPVVALGARRYESPGSAVLTVTDPLGLATGTFVLEVGPDGTGTARPGDPAAADVTLGVDVLSSLYLGGGDLTAASMAGRVVEHSPDAVGRVGRLFRTARAPWTGSWF